MLVWVLPIAGMFAWYYFASPKAKLGGTVVRPVAKVIIFSLATLALWDSGHETLAVMFFAFSVVINALALLPSIRVLVEQE